MKVKKYLLEFVTVVIGILIAFGLNAYAEQRKEKQKVNEFITGIELELKENLKEVTIKKEYHLELLKTLNENPDSAVLVIRPAFLKNYAWTLAEGSLLQKYLDYSDYKKLMEIYTMQDVLATLNAEIGEVMTYVNVVSPFFMAGAKEEGYDAQKFRLNWKKRWKPVFQEMSSIEGLLENLYTDYLAP